MRIFLYISLFMLTFTSFNGLTQDQDAVVKAYEYYRQKDFDNAKLWIDSAMYKNQINDELNWMLRGLIYRGLTDNTYSNYRKTALESFNKAKTLATAPASIKQINLAIRNTLVLTYNEVIDYMKKGKLVKSEAHYLIYKQQFLRYYDASYNFDEIDIDYYNALGSAWQSNIQYATLAEQEKQLDLAVEKWQKVLSIDPDNFNVIYSIGAAYYNIGADLIMNMKPITDIDTIEEMQDVSLRMFKNGLPYLLKALDLDPTNKEVIEGLRGIYRSLHDDEKYEYYNNLLSNL